MRPQTFAFVHLVVVAAVLALALLAGLALQVELFAPGMRWSAGFYGRALTVHGLALHAIAAPALAGCCGYLVIARLAKVERLRWPALAWVGLALWVIGLVAAIAFGWQTTASDSGWTLYDPRANGLFGPPGTLAWRIARLAFGASGLLYAIHLALLIRKAPPIKLAFAISFVAAIAYASLMSLYTTLTVEAIEALYTATATLGPAAVFAALILATVAVAGDEPHPVIGAVAIACAACAAFPAFRAVGLALVGLWIALAVLGGGRRPAIAFVLAGCVPAILLVSVAQVFTEGNDFPVHDTYVMVGAEHALAGMIVFAMLASVERAPHTVLAWIGTVVTSGGLVLHILASFKLGGGGMPRRYVDYLPDFTRGHQVAGLGGVIAIAGVIVLVSAWISARRHPRS